MLIQNLNYLFVDSVEMFFKSEGGNFAADLFQTFYS